MADVQVSPPGDPFFGALPPIIQRTRIGSSGKPTTETTAMPDTTTPAAKVLLLLQAQRARRNQDQSHNENEEPEHDFSKGRFLLLGCTRSLFFPNIATDGGQTAPE